MKLLNRLLYIFLMSVSSNKKKYKVCSRFHGVKFGKNVRITGFPRWASESYLISIGDNVTITQNVVFHTHDGGVHVFRNEVPGVNVYGKITVGNNVFIGSNVIILPGVTIGNNTVIGSGSIVSKDIPDNVVAVGVPARAIKTIEEYKEACLKKSIIIPPGMSKQEKEALICNHLA